MKLYKPNPESTHFIIINGDVPDGLEQTLHDVGYKEAGGVEEILKALAPDSTKSEEAPKKAVRKRRNILGL